MNGHKRAAVQADKIAPLIYLSSGLLRRTFSAASSWFTVLRLLFYLLQSWPCIFCPPVLFKVLTSLDLSDPSERSCFYHVWFWTNRMILQQKRLKALFVSLQQILLYTLKWLQLIDVHWTTCGWQRLQFWPGETNSMCAAQFLFFLAFAVEQMGSRFQLIGNVPHLGPTKANKTSLWVHVLLVLEAMHGRE